MDMIERIAPVGPSKAPPGAITGVSGTRVASGSMKRSTGFISGGDNPTSEKEGV